MRWISGAVEIAVSAVVILKLYAYVAEAIWLVRYGTSKLLPAYQADPIRTYEKDLAAERPRPISHRIDVGEHRWYVTAVGIGFKTPTVVVASSAISFAFGKWCPAAVSLVFASALAFLLVMALATILSVRLTLGPYDALNPDLQVGERLRGHLYRDGRSISLYLLALLLITISGFAAVYASLNHALPIGAFTGDKSTDPIRWIYFTLTAASTVGFGDIHANSDVARTFVIAQLGAGSLLLTWALSVFFGDQLPPSVNAAFDAVSTSATPLPTEGSDLEG